MQDEKLPLGAKISMVLAIGLGVIVTQGLESKFPAAGSMSNPDKAEQELKTSYTNQVAFDFEFRQNHWLDNSPLRTYHADAHRY